jgi:hypothetical protein
MFVCDIDVLLQHGPLDMLNRFKGYDVVFNQNEEGANAGSYLIGTLVLINPTSGGAVFANFLRAYFNNVLMRPEVTRWIHQFALLMGRTYTMRKSKKLKIGGFDKTIDINPSRDPDIDQDRFHFLSLEDAAEIVGDRDLQASYQTRVAAA